MVDEYLYIVCFNNSSNSAALSLYYGDQNMTSLTADLSNDEIKGILIDIQPHHMSVCSENDLLSIRDAVEQDRSFDEIALAPLGENKADVIITLKVIYWTLKIILVVISVIKTIDARDKTENTLKEVENETRKRLPQDTPSSVNSNISKIVGKVMKSAIG